jgi:predicted oxidoreductase
MINKNVIIILLFGIQNLLGQLSVSNFFEYQLGNLPSTKPTNLTTHFDQLNLSYRFDDFFMSGRLEHFQTKDRSASYDKLAQRTFVFNKNGFDITVGNFYQIFGRGLLLRTYEIPGY